MKGAKSSAIVYSMLDTAKANGLDPYDYLLYALSVLPYWGKSTSHEMLETAMFWSRDVQQRIGKEAQTESEECKTTRGRAHNGPSRKWLLGMCDYFALTKDLTNALFRAAILLTRVSKMALVLEVCPSTPNYEENDYEIRTDNASTVSDGRASPLG